MSVRLILAFSSTVFPAAVWQPVLGAERLPNVNIRGKTPPDIAFAWGLPLTEYDFHYQTNAWGFRNPPDLQDADLICVGDSLLVAIQHPYVATIPGLLAKSLARPTGNVSLIAKSIQEMQQVFRDLDLDLEGRVVLQFVCEDNDLGDSLGLATKDARHQLSVWQRTLLYRSILLAQKVTQPEVAQASRRQGSYAEGPVSFFFHHQSSPELDAQVPVVLDELRSFARYVTDRGGAFGVVLIPAKLRVLGAQCQLPADFEFAPVTDFVSPLPTALAVFAKREGVPYLSAEPALTQLAQQGELPWIRDDTHLSAAGHRVVADALAKWPWLRDALNR